MVTGFVTLLVLAVVVVLAVGLAWAPMHILVAQMAKSVHAFVQRQRDRRGARRETPDRRTLG